MAVAADLAVVVAAVRREPVAQVRARLLLVHKLPVVQPVLAHPLLARAVRAPADSAVLVQWQLPAAPHLAQLPVPVPLLAQALQEPVVLVPVLVVPVQGAVGPAVPRHHLSRPWLSAAMARSSRSPGKLR